MITEYEIVTSTYIIPLKTTSLKTTPLKYQYLHEEEIIKRVKFNEHVQYYIYEYQPLTAYKTIKYCIQKISRVLKSIV